MTRFLSTVAVLLLVCVAQVQAFAPPRPATFSAATRIAAAKPAHAAALVLRMAEGDFYDDEVSVLDLI